MACDAGQWAALRLLREHEVPVTHQLLAQAAGGELSGDDVRQALENAGQGIAHKWLLPTQLSAMRQLLAGEPPTLARVSAVAEVNLTILTVRGIKEEWKKPFIEHWRRRVPAELATDATVGEAVRLRPEPAMDAINAGPTAPQLALPQTAPADTTSQPEIGRAERVSRMLLKHADNLIAQVEAQGGVLTKPQLDVMLAMVRLAEKFEPLAAKEAAEQQKKSDAEVAEIYDRIEQRIHDRAVYFAHKMVASGTVPPPSRNRRNKLASERKQQAG